MNLAVLAGVLLCLQSSSIMTNGLSGTQISPSSSDYNMLAVSPKRALPEKILIGYATDCNENVKEAVRQGVNVVIWSFMEIKDVNSDPGKTQQSPINWNSLDPERLRVLISDLDEEGYTDIVHLVAFGGWNGPHLDIDLSAQEWFEIWKKAAVDIGFHGIDWDLEGHDNLQSPTNVFSLECLDMIGSISRLAKEEGYLVGMAPPQSYLDAQSSSFSRSVKELHEDRTWHADFHYFGKNVYAYLLAKYEDHFDLISIQFYESYSRAAMNIYGPNKTNAASYLEGYVRALASNDFSIYIEFESDPATELSNQRVALPRSKIIFGFANGWALNTREKALFVQAGDIKSAYEKLKEDKLEPRGFMFWVIGEEGANDIVYSPDLGTILNTRQYKSNEEL